MGLQKLHPDHATSSGKLVSKLVSRLVCHSVSRSVGQSVSEGEGDLWRFYAYKKKEESIMERKRKEEN